MEVINLQLTNYKEKDGLVLLFNHEGVYTYHVKGVQNPKSENIVLASALNIVDVEAMAGNYKYPIVKNTKVVFSPYTSKDSLLKMGVLALLQECTRQLLQDEEKPLIYDLLKKSLYEIKNETKSLLEIAIHYLLRVLKISGYEFEVNHCVFCGKKTDIVAFSFIEGGFICRDCMMEDIVKDLTPLQMRWIRYLSMDTDKQIDITLSDEDALTILNKLDEFVKDGLGITLHSIALINS